MVRFALRGRPKSNRTEFPALHKSAPVALIATSHWHRANGLLRLAFYEKRVKRVLVGIVIVYGIAVVMLGTTVYLDHIIPHSNTALAVSSKGH